MSQRRSRIWTPICKEDLDPCALKAIRRLQGHGFQAYLVGGCVRDLLLGIRPKDFDVVTSARPGQIRRIFRNSRIIGHRFRLVHIYYHNRVIEVSTFRSQPELDSGNRGGDLLVSRDNVYGDAEEDAFRRDFTINGLFYDTKAGEIIDYVGGLSDLRMAVVRCIGDPSIRFREDPVRMVRALKFAGRLGFTLDDKVTSAIREHRTQLRRSAPARILEELFKIIASGASQRILALLTKYRFMRFFLPELHKGIPGPEQQDALFWRMLHSLDATDQGRRLHSNGVLLATLLYPLADPTGSILKQGSQPAQGDLSSWAHRHVKSSPIFRNCARQDVSRLGQVLGSLRRFHLLDASHRFRSSSLLRQRYFVDSLALFAIGVRALEADPGLLNRWTRLAMERGIALTSPRSRFDRQRARREFTRTPLKRQRKEARRRPSPRRGSRRGG